MSRGAVRNWRARTAARLGAGGGRAELPHAVEFSPGPAVDPTGFRRIVGVCAGAAPLSSLRHGRCFGAPHEETHDMTMTDHGALTIRKYTPGDEHAILRTFNLVFRHECGPDYVDRDLAFWRWQFLDNPAGTQILLAVAADGTVAGQYCAVPQVADCERGQMRFVHVVDSMTHPDFRQGLKQQGLFATLGTQFTADYDEHGNEMGYGFPVRMAERIGRRLLDYSLLRSIEYWLREPQAEVPRTSASVQVRAVAEIPVEADELWRRCLPRRPCSVRKDHRYLSWRYAQGPQRDEYLRLAAWREGRLVGLMMLRPRHELVPGACTICDVVCHDDDDDTARALLASAARIARDAGRSLLGVFADHDPTAARLASVGASRRPSSDWLERRLTFRITGPSMQPEELDLRWRYSLGDTDLV